LLSLKTQSEENLCKVEKACRICNQEELEIVLDLGRQPLANALISKTKHGEPVRVFPLILVRCAICGCLQIPVTVNPAMLFGEYLYFSSYADALVKSASDLSEQLIDRFNIGPNDLVVDLGSNDGYLLQFYKAAQIPVLGVEPAENVATVAKEKRGIPTLVEYFSESVAKYIRTRYGSASIIHANNVIAHLANLHSFVEGMRILLRRSGAIVVEVAYVKDMIKTGAFDLIYHEHLCYYSLNTLQLLFQKHSLEVFDAEHIPAHGGSLRIYAGHPGEHKQTAGFLDIERDEKASGLDGPLFYKQFGDRVVALRRSLKSTLLGLRQDGLRIVAYGAAAKATVLLNFFHLDERTLLYVVDRNPEKQGKMLPGTNLEICPVGRIKADKPEVILITAWNYADEIMFQLSSYKMQGGIFVIPLPVLRIVK